METQKNAPVQSLTLSLPPCVLAVDDDEMTLMMVEHILGGTYEVVKATSGAEALAYLAAHTVDLVLLDYMMPDLDGMTILARIRETPATEDLPVILLTGDMTPDLEARGFSAGATDFLHKPFFPDVLRMRVARILRYEYLQAHLESEVERKTALAEERLASSRRLLDELILALAKTIDVKDRYTRGHSERVADYAREIARRAGDDEAAQATIYAVGLLHDIGKIGVPVHIINKPSRRSYRDALPQEVARSEIEKGRGTQFDPVFADIMLQMIEEDTEFNMRDTGN